MVYRDQPTELFIKFSDDGTPTDPTTVMVELMAPDGTVQTHTGEAGGLTNPAVGTWSYIFSPGQVGRWEFRWTGSGVLTAQENGTIEVFEQPFDGGTARPGWKPAVEEVAALLRARTKDDRGEELGTFTETTRPTQVQVEFYINIATGLMVACTGDWLPESLWQFSRYVIATRAAMDIERAYWPEQQDPEDGVYNRLKLEYDKMSASLCELAGPYRPDDAPGSDGAAALPIYYFGDVPTCSTPQVWYDPTFQTGYLTIGNEIVGYRAP